MQFLGRQLLGAHGHGPAHVRAVRPVENGPLWARRTRRPRSHRAVRRRHLHPTCVVPRTLC